MRLAGGLVIGAAATPGTTVVFEAPGAEPPADAANRR